MRRQKGRPQGSHSRDLASTPLPQNELAGEKEEKEPAPSLPPVPGSGDRGNCMEDAWGDPALGDPSHWVHATAREEADPGSQGAS